MKTAVVILNWNGEGFLKKYLPSVVSSVEQCRDARVVVADNASTDGSIKLLESDFPSVEILPMSSNYGFAKGYDKALRRLDDDLFILLNSDVETPDGWLEPLVEWMELHSDCGICGPKLLSLKERERFEYAGAAGGFIDRYGYPFCRGRVMDMLEKDNGQYDVPCEVMWIGGAALAVRKSVFQDLGGFRPEFFMHMEEIDLCWRARMKGWKVHYVPRSRVYHLGGGTLVKDSPSKIFYNHRNNLLMLHSNLPYTCSLMVAFGVEAELSDQDAGPDFFRNCYDSFIELDAPMRKEICEFSVKLGIKMMRATLAKRYVLDILSAFGYLLRGNCRAFTSVFKAHSDFRRMRTAPKPSVLRREVANALEGKADGVVHTMLTNCDLETDCANIGLKQVALKGMLDRWIVWQRFFHKKDIFSLIKDNLI